MTGLVEFLRARLDEDEAAARAATPGPWEVAPVVYGAPEDGWGDPQHWEIKAERTDVVGHQVHEGGGVYEAADAEHIARHDPARVLVEVAAKRQIIVWHEVASESPELDRDAWQIMRQTLLQLATPYADHPDYDERWRP